MGVDTIIQVKPDNKLSDKEILNLSVRICEAFGAHRFSISEEYGHAIRYNGYNEDPEILEVHTCQRYYGPGYERGDLPFIILVCEWLRINIPGKVYYGGDSGNELTLYTNEFRDDLIQHFARNGHIPYHGDLNGNERNPFMKPDSWNNPFCNFCQVYYRRFGYGNNYGSYTCAGCGKEKYTDDGGVTWIEGNKYK